VSTIPLSLQLLPYISQFRPFGILESIIRQTVQDVYLFAAIYVVWISGFSVFFHSTFTPTSPSLSDGEQFTSTASTALYLFKSTLGQIDFSVFNEYSEYTLYGIMVYVAFIMLTTVLLLNLLIAQINNTFIVMQNNASENYAFDRAKDVKTHLLLYERNPLWIVPPPFNLITIFLWPLHYWIMTTKDYSLCGCVSDVIVWLLFLLPRLFAECVLFLSNGSNDPGVHASSSSDARDADVHYRWPVRVHRMDPDPRFFVDYRLKLLDEQTVSAVVYDNELFAEEDIRTLFPDVTLSTSRGGSLEAQLRQIIYNQDILLKDAASRNEELSREIALVKDQLHERSIINTSTQQQQQPQPLTI